MTDTTTTLIGTTAWVSGAQAVTASAALFDTDGDYGRLLAMKVPAPARIASTAYSAGAIFYSSYAGVERIYRVTKGGTTAAAVMAGTSPDYDLAAPHDASAGVIDGTATLLYLGQGRLAWAWGTITDITDSQHAEVTFDPRGPLASVTATQNWKLGEFAPFRGYPRAGMFHRARLWLAGSLAKPQTLWASETGDFTGFAATQPDGTVLDTSAITETIDDDQFNEARWLAPLGKRGLAIGTAGGEFTVTPASTNAPLSPSNIDVLRQSDRGTTDNVPAIRIGDLLLFFEDGGRRLRALEYDFGSDRFATPDLSILSDHLLLPGIVDAAYQRRPIGTLWMVRDDGVVLTMTIDKDQKVRAWSRHSLGGTDAAAESVCCVPNPTNTADDVYLTVRRTIDGATVRTIECIRPPFREDVDTQPWGFFVDCGLSYSGAAVNAVAGLDHLEGEIVWICADGSARQNQTVSGGAVYVTGPAATVIHVGLPYTFEIVTLPPERGAGAALGSAQGRMQDINHLTLRLFESGGGARFGAPDGQLDAITFRTAADPIGRAVPLFTGDRRLTFPGGSDRNGQVQILHEAPLPFTVLGIIQERATNG